jgi:hypothetical protein
VKVGSGSGGKLCPPGTELRPVMCIRAPCPPLCLPKAPAQDAPAPAAQQ